MTTVEETPIMEQTVDAPTTPEWVKLQDNRMKLKDLPLARGAVGQLLATLCIKMKQLDSDKIPTELTEFVDSIETFYKDASDILSQDDEKSDILWNTFFFKWFPFQVGKNYPNNFVASRWHFSAQIDELVGTIFHRFRWWNRVLRDGFSPDGGHKIMWAASEEFHDLLEEFVNNIPIPHEKEITLPNGNTRTIRTERLVKQMRDEFELEERVPKPPTISKSNDRKGSRGPRVPRGPRGPRDTKLRNGQRSFKKSIPVEEPDSHDDHDDEIERTESDSE